MKNLKEKLCDALDAITLKPIAVCAAFALTAQPVNAQEDDKFFKLPEFKVPGAKDTDTPLQTFFAVIKLLLAFGLWILVALMAFTVIKNTVKGINKSRRDEESAIGAILGEISVSLGGLLFSLAMAGWITLSILGSGDA